MLGYDEVDKLTFNWRRILYPVTRRWEKVGKPEESCWDEGKLASPCSFTRAGDWRRVGRPSIAKDTTWKELLHLVEGSARATLIISVAAIS